MREAIGCDAAGGHSLETIIANRCRGTQPFVDIARLQLHAPAGGATRLRSGMSPDVCKTVRLQLESDG